MCEEQVVHFLQPSSSLNMSHCVCLTPESRQMLFACIVKNTPSRRPDVSFGGCQAARHAELTGVDRGHIETAQNQQRGEAFSSHPSEEAGKPIYPAGAQTGRRGSAFASARPLCRVFRLMSKRRRAKLPYTLTHCHTHSRPGAIRAARSAGVYLGFTFHPFSDKPRPSTCNWPCRSSSCDPIGY